MRKSDYPKVLRRGVAVMVILLLLLFFGAFAPVAMAQPLVANFTHTAPQCYCTDINFYGTATGGSPSYNYSWDFGDGNSSTGQTTSHHYGAAGTYTVNLTVTDSGSPANTSSINKTVQVWPTPIANFTTNSPQLYCHNITFNDTTTGGTPPYTYHWDFGDGSSSTEQNPSHLYIAGTYNVTLTVTDANGCTNSTTRSVVASTYSVGLSVKKASNVSSVTVGTVIEYNITVYNTGEVNLTSVLVTDPLTGLYDTIPFLEHGTNQIVNTTYTVTQARCMYCVDGKYSNS